MSSDARAPIRRAILSVTDKTGLVDFAQKLAGSAVELISTGGTAKMLRASGISVKDISELTGLQEMLDGRVNTIDPKVQGGILHRRENPSHRTAVAEHGIQPIDMVVVNLYAFEKTAAKPGVHFEDLIENIDIGGPSMIRSAAKNFQDVAVVTSPEDYSGIAEEMAKSGAAVANARQLQGKELSYNNIVDLQAAWDLAQEFDEPVCAIIKHTNPCGTATGKTLTEAYKKALECDPVSAFGGVIGVNRPIDADAAEEMAKLFLEVIAAPSFDESARATFAAKKNLRLIEISHAPQKWVLKNVSGGILVQDADVRPLSENDLKVVTKRQPTAEEKRALLFAWKVCKHVKSNAILYARDGQTVGVGAGQMSRVDSCKIGAQKAVLPLKGTVAASDAFFPFPDGVEEIAKAGASAIIQPGGSVRDQEIIEAADRFWLAMIFTDVWQFRH